MNITISTNAYHVEDFPLVFDAIHALPGENIGIEVFPMFHDPEFEGIFRPYVEEMKNMPITFHGPYFQTEHSKKAGTPEYERSMAYFRQSLAYCQELQGKFVVFHHNNCKIHDKEEIMAVSRDNLTELSLLCQEKGTALVVENAGVMSRQNMLFNQDEFLEEAKRYDNDILIDIGHAYANQWDLKQVISQLKDRIVAYHLHHNDGNQDSHLRIVDGAQDFATFLSLHQEFTPQADLILEYNNGFSKETDIIVADLKILCEYRRNGVEV